MSPIVHGLLSIGMTDITIILAGRMGDFVRNFTILNMIWNAPVAQVKITEIRTIQVKITEIRTIVGPIMRIANLSI